MDDSSGQFAPGHLGNQPVAVDAVVMDQLGQGREPGLGGDKILKICCILQSSEPSKTRGALHCKCDITNKRLGFHKNVISTLVII